MITTLTSSDRAILVANAVADRCSRWRASRLVRLDTGIKTLAVFVSQTASNVNGAAGRRSEPARVNTTGVSSTVVVSRLIQIVTTVPSAGISRKKWMVPPPARRAQAAEAPAF